VQNKDNKNVKKLIDYVKESFEELVNKVTWPSYKSLQGTASLVVIATVIFSLVVFGIDKLFDLLVDFIYKTS